MVEVLKIELFSPESAIALAGNREENLKLIARQTGAKLVLRGQELLISGTNDQILLSQRLIQAVERYWGQEKPLSSADILTAQQAIETQQQDELQDLQKDILARTRRGYDIRAKTFRQRQYIQSVRTHDLTFCIGPAGTGKTFLAAVLGVQALLNNEFERLILTRPAVEAGEKLGESDKAPLTQAINKVRDAITPRTKVILVNSPCNPTGYVASEADLPDIPAATPFASSPRTGVRYCALVGLTLCPMRKRRGLRTAGEHHAKTP